jgi:hypothetical protein
VSFNNVQTYLAARIPNLVLFLISCALAWNLNWNANDLAWSLWLSNLFITGAIIVCTTALAARKEAAFVLIGAGLFLLAISFHVGQITPLTATLPFKGSSHTPHSFKETSADVFITYWMWLPIAFYHCRDFLFHPPNFINKEAKSKNPLKSIIFFNALIYVLILFNKILRLDGFVAALFVYFFYFFLFDRDLTKRK